MNQLRHALSPYLLQHQDNPVHWQEWSEQAFIEAKEKDMPVFLSIGYAACHWCHVMAHESFEDEATADYLNKHFICIKVDREQRPDIDAIYMRAVTAITGQGGWPLTAFLTPDKKPFYGGTYFPKTTRYGMISFMELLHNITDAWNNQRQQLIDQSQQLTAHIQNKETQKVSRPIELAPVFKAYSQLEQAIDHTYGGLEGAPKFPQVPLWSSILNVAIIDKQQPLLKDCYLTAEKICQGGIYDHLGGGFCRYSTDEKWLAPHFEKMLYDNALLIDFLSDLYGYQETPLFKERVYETVNWLQQEMCLSNGCYAAALDADSEGEEGKFYTWQWSELIDILGDDTASTAAYYDLSTQGNWEQKNILYRNHSQHTDISAQQLNAIKTKLLTHRQQRPRPQQDDKILLDWNALLVAALAKASVIFNDSDLLKQAQDLYINLKACLRTNNQWQHTYRDGKYQKQPLLDDYASIIQALIQLHCASGEAHYLDEAEIYLKESCTLFFDEENHLFWQATQTNDLILNPYPLHDNATPSGNGLMAVNLAQLLLLTGGVEHEQLFQQLTTAMTAHLPDLHFSQMPLLINALCWFEHALKIQGNWREIQDTSLSTLVLRVQSNDNAWLCCDRNSCRDSASSLEMIRQQFNH